MIFGHLNNTRPWHYPEFVLRAVNYLTSHDLAGMAAGRYQDDATGWQVQILDLHTVPHDQNYPEAHRRHIDVQFLVSGNEYMGVATQKADLAVHQAYNEERDIIFYQDVPHETLLLMQPGNFAVFFPEDIHRPNCVLNNPEAIRKVVIKIPVADVT